jgi:hypothetical protein
MKNIFRRITSKYLALLLALIGFSVATPALAVENGVLDRSHKAVGSLGFDIDGPDGATPPFSLCSGFVISDRAFATAAHCTEYVKHIAVSWAVTLKPGSPKDPVAPPGIFDLTVYNFWDFPILADTVTATGYYPHPNFDWATLANDVAVLEFPPGTFSVQPVRLPSVGFLDWLETVGALYEVPVVLAGYGGHEDLGNFLVAIRGYRQRGFAVVSSLTEQSLILGTNKVFDSRTMAGDSGSPQFMLGRAVSVTSMGIKQRLDTPLTVSFLAAFADRAE